MDFLLLVLAGFFVLFLTFIAFIRRYRRCPSDKILVVYGKIAGGGQGLSAKCYHGGAAFIWPVIQDYRFLDLTPMAIDIKLEGALSLQNIRVNTPSTFTVGISTEPGVMENAAERMLHMDMKQVAELARDLIFGQMRVVIATMPIEEINADRDKLIENISTGVEVELKKVGLRLINVNIQDITDESGYIDALGREAAARAINEAKIKVSEQERDGSIGAANADRDQRIKVASAGATAVEGENESAIKVAQSNARRREQEAEAERAAIAAEKVKTAQALEEAYKAEEAAERQRATREEASQSANVLVPAQIKKAEIETLAEADAERIRRLKKGEADGLRALMEAEAEGLRAILTRKAEGFDKIVSAARGLPELASLLLVTEQLPKLVEEQVKAISNLKIDSVTVWEGGRNSKDGKTATADFVSGLVGSLPPLHELTRNVGIKLPEYLGRMEHDGEGPEGKGGGGGGPEGPGGRPPRPALGGEGRGEGTGATARPERVAEGVEREGRDEAGGGPKAATPPPVEPTPPRAVPPTPAALESKPTAVPAATPTRKGAAPKAGEVVADLVRSRVRGWLESHPAYLQALDRDRDGHLSSGELEAVIDTAVTWAEKARQAPSKWFYARGGKWEGPKNWYALRQLGAERPGLPVNLEGDRAWLPFGAVAEALEETKQAGR